MSWIEIFELDAGILGGEPPVHGSAEGVARLLPGGHLLGQRLGIRDALAGALGGRNRQLDLSEAKLLHLLRCGLYADWLDWSSQFRGLREVNGPLPMIADVRPVGNQRPLPHLLVEFFLGQPKHVLGLP